MLELEELARTMGGLAKRHDAGIADDPAQALQIGKSPTGFHCREGMAFARIQSTTRVMIGSTI